MRGNYEDKGIVDKLVDKIFPGNGRNKFKSFLKNLSGCSEEQEMVGEEPC